MTPPPRVSVILPAYNVSSFVEQTIACLSAQDWPAIELIAVDDGSTDETATILRSALEAFRQAGPERSAELVRQQNGGLGAARNAGIARASGGLILFVDADDLIAPGALSQLVNALCASPDTCLVFPRCRYIDETGAPMGVESDICASLLTAVDLLAENPVHTDTGVLLRRETLDRAGPFDPGLPSAIGLDVWVRATRGHGACVRQVPQVLVSYRRRSRQITADWRRQKAGWETVRTQARDQGLLSARHLRRARARVMIVWASRAYAAGAGRDLRRLVAGAMLRDPRAVLGSAHGRIRLATAATSFLPQAWQDRLALWYARRTGSVPSPRAMRRGEARQSG